MPKLKLQQRFGNNMKLLQHRTESNNHVNIMYMAYATKKYKLIAIYIIVCLILYNEVLLASTLFIVSCHLIHS